MVDVYNYDNLEISRIENKDHELIRKILQQKPFHPIFSTEIESCFSEKDKVATSSFKVTEEDREIAFVSVRVLLKNVFPANLYDCNGPFNPQVFFLGVDSLQIDCCKGIMKTLSMLSPSNKEGISFEFNVDAQDDYNNNVIQLLKPEFISKGSILYGGITYENNVYILKTPLWWMGT